MPDELTDLQQPPRVHLDTTDTGWVCRLTHEHGFGSVPRDVTCTPEGDLLIAANVYRSSGYDSAYLRIDRHGEFIRRWCAGCALR